MRLRLRYGRLVDVENETVRWRPSRVVDDVLGLRLDLPYAARLVQYGDLRRWAGADDPDRELAVAVGLGADANLFQPTPAVRQRAQRLRQRFTAAAFAAAEGQLHPELAQHLANVRQLPGGEIEVEDLPALAAWSLAHLLAQGPVAVAPCALCALPWLIERGTAFCKRPAPGTRRAVSCRYIAAQRAYEDAHADFRRERKRLHERKRRGTLSQEEYDAWIAENRAGERGTTWMQFDEWKASREEQVEEPRQVVQQVQGKGKPVPRHDQEGGVAPGRRKGEKHG